MPAEMIRKCEHERQINAYTAELPAYELYATALKEVLEKACKATVPQAVVQARPKAVSSFAEKCVRKYDKYKNAVHQLTDLCGARVIVQTLEQVQAVRNFIEANFTILEKDDKGLLLHGDEFGYRDMHYIVQLTPGRATSASRAERDAIGDRKAEIQVRTWVQHAWADTLHDRMYKTKLNCPPEIKRTGALLAASWRTATAPSAGWPHEIDGMSPTTRNMQRRASWRMRSKSRSYS